MDDSFTYRLCKSKVFYDLSIKSTLNDIDIDEYGFPYEFEKEDTEAKRNFYRIVRLDKRYMFYGIDSERSRCYKEHAKYEVEFIRIIPVTRFDDLNNIKSCLEVNYSTPNRDLFDLLYYNKGKFTVPVSFYVEFDEDYRIIREIPLEKIHKYCTRQKVVTPINVMFYSPKTKIENIYYSPQMGNTLIPRKKYQFTSKNPEGEFVTDIIVNNTSIRSIVCLHKKKIVYIDKKCTHVSIDCIVDTIIILCDDAIKDYYKCILFINGYRSQTFPTSIEYTLKKVNTSVWEHKYYRLGLYRNKQVNIKLSGARDKKYYPDMRTYPLSTGAKRALLKKAYKFTME